MRARVGARHVRRDSRPASSARMSVLLPYLSMAYNNGWANYRLLKACRRLSQDEFDAPRTGFFPSLRATLNHILTVDLFYVDAMEGGTLGPAAWLDPEPCKTIAALHAAQADVDRRLIVFVEGLDDGGLEHIVDVHRGDRVQRERLDRLLLHLFQHQIHHRGQAHAMMSGTSAPHPSSMNSSRPAKRRCAPRSLRSSAGQRQRSGRIGTTTPDPLFRQNLRPRRPRSLRSLVRAPARPELRYIGSPVHSQCQGSKA